MYYTGSCECGAIFNVQIKIPDNTHHYSPDELTCQTADEIICQADKSEPSTFVNNFKNDRSFFNKIIIQCPVCNRIIFDDS